MIQIQEKKMCCGCHGCAAVCPKKCITMIPDSEGFYYPQVDVSSCIHCGLCERVCPVENAQPDSTQKSPAAFAAWNNDDKIRARSSSGGVFTLLAQKVIQDGGTVFGAAWSTDFRTVTHIAVTAEEDLAKLRGSKYLQSTIGTCYSQAKEALERGVKVLFSGTPCQIGGLRAFLRKEYENLLCVDLVCHGVPAPSVWRTYIAGLEGKMKSSVSEVSFRNKETGWKSYCVNIGFDSGKVQSVPVGQEPYMRAFLSNACLRPSCHDCRFKKKNRESDLTLADFWGIEQVCPSMDDDRGTSLVLVHSRAGQNALDEIRSALKMEAVDADAALRENPSAVVSSVVHENREAFLNHLHDMEFADAVKKWLPRKISPKERVYNLLQNMGLLEIIKKVLRRT